MTSAESLRPNAREAMQIMMWGINTIDIKKNNHYPFHLVLLTIKVA